MYALFFVAFLAPDITVAENPVAPTSFVEASVKLADGESVIWLVVPEPTKTVEVGNTIYFNGPVGQYSVTSIIFTATGMKVTTRKSKATITITAPSILQQAFNADTDADKATSAAKLASLYRTAATFSDPTIVTNADLFAMMKKASSSMLADAAIPNTRKAIGATLNPIFASATAPIDKVKVQATFSSIADSLGSLK